MPQQCVFIFSSRDGQIWPLTSCSQFRSLSAFLMSAESWGGLANVAEHKHEHGADEEAPESAGTDGCGLEDQVELNHLQRHGDAPVNDTSQTAPPAASCLLLRFCPSSRQQRQSRSAAAEETNHGASAAENDNRQLRQMDTEHTRTPAARKPHCR